MNTFVKGLLLYTVQVAVALAVGGTVGSLCGIGLIWLTQGEVSREQVLSTINGAICATTVTIVAFSGLGILPVKARDPVVPPPQN